MASQYSGDRVVSKLFGQRVDRHDGVTLVWNEGSCQSALYKRSCRGRRRHVPETISHDLFAGLLTASFGVWAWIAVCLVYRWRQPLPFQAEGREVPNQLTAWLALSWIAFQLVSVVADSLSRYLYGGTEELSAETSLVSVQFSCVINIFILAMFTLLLAGAPDRRLSDFGIDLQAGGRELTYGTLGFLASVLPVTAVLAGLQFGGALTPESQHSFLRLLQQDSGCVAIAWIVFAVVVLAPLTEELLFRVILQGWLESYLPAGWAVVIAAACFSAVHGWPNALPIFPLALILGYVFHRRHSAYAVIALHSLFNASNLIRAILTPWTEDASPAVLTLP